jgi:ABC-type dipeptide/oligopeptide/nickel transport system permease subunit
VGRALERRLWSLAAGMILLAPLLVLTLAGLVSRLLPGAGAEAAAALVGPSLGHPFGTDAAGRDLLCLVVAGAGSTYCVGLVGSVVALALGVALGLATASPRAEAAVLTGVQIVEALPVLVWALMVMSAYAFWTGAFAPESAGRALLEAARTAVSAAVIGLSFTPRVIRLVRDQVKFFEREDFIVHARAHGVSKRRILWYHVLFKNALADLLLLAAALPGLAILTQINLDYFFSLGSFRVGAATTTSWTQLLLAGEARRALLFREHGWVVVFPAVCVVATTLGCLLWGTGLRRARALRVFDHAPAAPARPSAAPEAPLVPEVSP